jgi:hypothetical protein
MTLPSRSTNVIVPVWPLKAGWLPKVISTNGASATQTVEALPMSSVAGSVVVLLLDVVDDAAGCVDDVGGVELVTVVVETLDGGSEVVVVVAADDDVVDAGCVVDVDVLDVAGVDDDVLVDVVTPWVLGTQSGHVDVVGELVVGYVVVLVGHGPPHISRVSGWALVAAVEPTVTAATNADAAKMTAGFMA